MGTELDCLDRGRSIADRGFSSEWHETLIVDDLEIVHAACFLL